MSDNDNNTSGKVQFIESHIPALQLGDYTIKVNQKVTIHGQNPPVTIDILLIEKEQRLSVLGPRFSIDPQEVQAVFPPPGSLGEHSNVLPHVILKRSTLPWERSAHDGQKDVPWLALLLFDENDMLHTDEAKNKLLLDQIKSPNSWKISELNTSSVDLPKSTDQNVSKTKFNLSFPSMNLEKGDHNEDMVAVIDVPQKVLEAILPSKEELKLLTHVRQTTNADGDAQGDEVAVIICNRLPRSGSVSIVHLVSLEERYDDQGFKNEGDLIRLVSLYSWRFACVSEKHSFKGLLMHLNRPVLFSIPASLQVQDALNNAHLPDELSKAFAAAGYRLSSSVNVQPDTKNGGWQVTDGNASYILNVEQSQIYVHRINSDKLGTLRLPDIKVKDPELQKNIDYYLAKGCVPLAHEMRQGNKSVSWYHGPFVAGSNGTTNPLPVHSGDELVLYDQTIGMFDVSYSAAWELGRLLTLQNKPVSVDLFNWKRSHAQSLRDAQQKPDSVTTWFKNLALLKGLPFNYLVPDERLLPTESIRFFQVDPLWVECLRDGAFSIGRVLASDHDRDKAQEHEDITEMSGFLLRSDVVSGWPGLLVDGYRDRDAKNKLILKRMDRLSKNVLLCLFEGVILTVDIHLKPETLHFGVSPGDENHVKDNDPVKWYKTVRNEDGSERKEWIEVVVDDINVVNVTDLVQRITTDQTSSELAMQMIEGVDKVRFVSSKALL